MTKKISKRSPVTLARSLPDGGERTYPGDYVRIRDLGQSVAYYYADNNITSRPEASKLGMAAEKAFLAGESYSALGVTFTISASGREMVTKDAFMCGSPTALPSCRDGWCANHYPAPKTVTDGRPIRGIS